MRAHRRASGLFFAVLAGGVLSGMARVQSSQPTSRPADHTTAIREILGRIAAHPGYYAEMEELKNIATEEDLPLLHDTLKRGSHRTKRATAWVLASIRSPQSVKPLIIALRSDGDWKIRQEAALSLGHMHAIADEAVPDLIKTLNSDPIPGTRSAAANALNAFGTRKALEAIAAADQLEKDAGVKKVLADLIHNPGFKRHVKARLVPGQVIEGYSHGTRYLVYAPKKRDPKHPLHWLVLVHGTASWPEGYIGFAKNDAEAHNVILLAPQFNTIQYTWFGIFNMRRGMVRPDKKILEIVDELSTGVRINKKRIYIYGHSEGGQFVNRFVLTHPDRIERAGVSSCGIFVLNDSTRPFPVGTGPPAQAPDLGHPDFGELVKAHLAVVNGTAEDVGHLTGAEYFMNAVHSCAVSRGIKSQVRFFPVEGGGHSGSSNWTAARRFFFTPDPAEAGGYEVGPITLKKAPTTSVPR